MRARARAAPALTLGLEAPRLRRHGPPVEPRELAEFFQYGPEERALLEVLRPSLEKHADALVAEFYRHLLSFPETRRLLRDPEVVERLLDEQREYLLSLAGPEIDEAYGAQRRRIGEIHERIGLEPRWYLGPTASTSRSSTRWSPRASSPRARTTRAARALGRLILLDASIAIHSYVERHERDLEYLNRELAASGRRLAQDLARTDSALRVTAERARAAQRLASIGTPVAGLAHEIGTPMGVIQGHAKLLEGALADENARWRLRTIQEQIGRISRILQSLLDMARPGRPRRMPVDLVALLDNTLAFLTEKLARRGIRVTRDYPSAPSVPRRSGRLEQVFLNVFLNAADATPAGGELRVAIRPQGDEVEVRIADTGHGIPACDLERVFEPFYTTKAAGEGCGLGLAVAHGIVGEHHGAIEVARSDAAGTAACCFRATPPWPPSPG